MLTAANVSSEMAVNYFIKNYYHQGKSRWSGLGAEKLGLSGAVDDEEAFKNVIEGRAPDGTEQLNARVLKPKERRAALDCTFSAPKSVSLMVLVGGDTRLMEAHLKAVRETLALAESRYARTRVTDEQGRHIVYTGNLVVAEFDHIESRELDPHLHTHCLIMNATQADGKWMSLVNNEIFANKKFLGMAYQSYLAREVLKLGYQVEPKKHGQFEIKGFKEQDLEANGTKLRYSPCPDWFPASRPGIHHRRLRLLFLDERQSLSEYVPSLKTGNEATQAFGLFLVPFI